MAEKKYGKKQDAGGGSSMKPFAIVLGGAVVIAVGAIAWSSTRAAFSGAAIAPIEMTFESIDELVALAQGVEIGDPNAPVMIMEFGDYQCPACRQFATSVKPTLDLALFQTGQARMVFHDFPLQQHPHSFLAARAARCALDQGDEHFWPYHDKLFQEQGSWSPSQGPPIGDFEDYAAELGLDEGTFSACLNSDRFADVVTANLELGVRLQVGSTPTVFASANGQTTRVARWSDPNAYFEIVEQLTGTPVGGAR